jgi:hypothetical protein
VMSPSCATLVATLNGVRPEGEYLPETRLTFDHCDRRDSQIHDRITAIYVTAIDRTFMYTVMMVSLRRYCPKITSATPPPSCPKYDSHNQAVFCVAGPARKGSTTGPPETVTTASGLPVACRALMRSSCTPAMDHHHLSHDIIYTMVWYHE